MHRHVDRQMLVFFDQIQYNTLFYVTKQPTVFLHCKRPQGLCARMMDSPTPIGVITDVSATSAAFH